MCALRDNRSVSAVSLACKYRLSQQPNRPSMKKLSRRRKVSAANAGMTDGAENADDISARGRTDSTISGQAEEDEEFDFDDDDDLEYPVDDVELSQRYYLMACKEMKIHSIRNIFEGLVNEKMQCKGQVLLKDDVKACTIALLGNSNCECIVFDGNEIGQEAAQYFGDVFERNNYLTDIRITWNGLGTPGAEAICKGLLKNHYTRVLDLTGNQFNEDAAKYFKELMVENSALYELYLGHNYFREEGGELLGEGLEQNDFLRVLDLSWNHLRLKGAQAIGKALASNINLEVLNVAWNGFYIHGVSHIAMALTKNQALTDLDISCNRLSETCLGQFLKGMEKNTTLKKLRISRNHISHTGVLALLQHIQKFPTIGLQYVDIGDQHVQDDFVVLLKELQKTRKIDVQYGMVWSRDRDPIGKQDQTEDELALLNENPHYVLMEFMRLQKLRLVDLFHQMDTDKSKGISVQEFQEGLKAVDIPLKMKTLEKFVRACDLDKNGEIEYVELVEASKRHKEEIRRLSKTNVPMENTDLGRIQKLLRKIMLNNRGLPVNNDKGTDTNVQKSVDSNGTISIG
ncbi:leucine-rich repeat-containing protein 74B-like [Mercenaria mercenaria]|uniref:leucine-rich repeat-containing protein 74B-like n=1 Tax=Mercenaria mercenaria TaxID=6596 RepID=UPI00234E56F6|nr:leucine-rich repeat-containing protein 74B-like [Mercenaria mercenaria]